MNIRQSPADGAKPEKLMPAASTAIGDASLFFTDILYRVKQLLFSVFTKILRLRREASFGLSLSPVLIKYGSAFILLLYDVPVKNGRVYIEFPGNFKEICPDFFRHSDSMFPAVFLVFVFLQPRVVYPVFTLGRFR